MTSTFGHRSNVLSSLEHGEHTIDGFGRSAAGKRTTPASIQTPKSTAEILTASSIRSFRSPGWENCSRCSISFRLRQRPPSLHSALASIPAPRLPHCRSRDNPRRVLEDELVILRGLGKRGKELEDVILQKLEAFGEDVHSFERSSRVAVTLNVDVASPVITGTARKSKP